VLRFRGSHAKAADATPVTITNTTANNVPASVAVPASPCWLELAGPGFGVPFGPGSGGSFAITSLAATNFGSSSATFRVYQPGLSGSGSCSGASVISGGQGLRARIPAGQTVNLTFPGPIVITPSNGLLCTGADFINANRTYLTVVGFTN